MRGVLRLRVYLSVSLPTKVNYTKTKVRNGNQPAREAALHDVTATLKEPGFFARIRWHLRF